MGSLVACKECPGDWNAAPSQRQILRLEGNGVARSSVRVRWWHVLWTATPTHTADFCVSSEAVYNCSADTYCDIPPLSKSMCLFLSGPRTPIFFSVGVMVRGIWRGAVLPWDSSRMRLGRTAGQGTWRPRYKIQHFPWQAGLHVFVLLPWEWSSRGDSSQAKWSTSCTLSIHP